MNMLFIPDPKRLSFEVTLFFKDPKNQKTIEIYRLWKEFLGRSPNFREACKDIRQELVKQGVGDPFSPFRSYALYLQELAAFRGFFSQLSRRHPFKKPDPDWWTAENVFSKLSASRQRVFPEQVLQKYDSRKELLINYLVFGNIFKDPKWIFWQRVMIMNGLIGDMVVLELHEFLNYIIGGFGSGSFKSPDDLVNCQDIMEDMKRYFRESESTLSLCIMNPPDDKNEVAAAVADFIAKKKTHGSIRDRKGGRSEANQFFGISGRLRLDSLKTYLDTYDLRAQKKKHKEIVTKFYKIDRNDGDNESHLRVVKRYFRKAKTIIANVEKGFFPGPY